MPPTAEELQRWYLTAAACGPPTGPTPGQLPVSDAWVDTAIN